MVLLMMMTGCTMLPLVTEQVCVLEELAETQKVIFADLDEDGYLDPENFSCVQEPNPGSPWVAVQIADLDLQAWDCDDTNGDITLGWTWYADADLDGYGDDLVIVQACEQPEGYVDQGEDCDDASADFHPGAAEDDCTDPNDYNCDGSVQYEDKDEDGFAACEDCDDSDDASTVELTWYADADLDGYGDPDAEVKKACEQPDGYVADNTDCDDTSSDFHPGAAEDDCTDPNDYNCDGSTGYDDADSDGVPACEDCDDSRADVHPGADEVCDEDDVDEDCDGLADNEDDSVDPEADGGTEFYVDGDNDGYGSTSTAWFCDLPSEGYVTDSTDCDDADAATYPGADEYCDGKDTDCDTTLDEDDALDADTWYQDSDTDGYGDSSSTTASCTQPSGYVADSTDCDDSDDHTHPGAAELDSTTDCMTDADEDGYGSDSPASGVTAGTDCDDSTTDVNPDAKEYCGTTDHDCDGMVGDDDNDVEDGNTYYADDDSDGYGDPNDTIESCDTSAPSGYEDDSDDCDDTDANVNPGATEDWGLSDMDCDLQPYGDSDGDGIDDELGVAVTGGNVIDDESAMLTDSTGTATIGSWASTSGSSSTLSSSDLRTGWDLSSLGLSSSSHGISLPTSGTAVTDDCVEVSLSTSSGTNYVCSFILWNSGTNGNELCFYQGSTSNQISCQTYSSDETMLTVTSNFTGTGSDDLLVCSGSWAGGAWFGGGPDSGIACWPY